MEIHLFETKLNEQGKNFLVRINKWAKLFYGCTIATCIFDLISAWLVLKSYLKYSGNYPSVLRFQTITTMIFLIIYPALLVGTGYFFYQFSKKSVKAIEYEDEQEYNQALSFLLKHITAASVLFTLNSIWAFIIVVLQIKLGY